MVSAVGVSTLWSIELTLIEPRAEVNGVLALLPWTWRLTMPALNNIEIGLLQSPQGVPLAMTAPLATCAERRSPDFYSASVLLAMHAMQSAVARQICPSVCLSVPPSFRHVPVTVFYPDEWRYDRAVYIVRYDNHSSFWRGKVYRDIHRESPPARALKWKIDPCL